MKLCFLLMMLCCCSAAFAVSQPQSHIIDRLRILRLKQQDEERAIRVQGHLSIQQTTACAPVEEARERLRELQETTGDGKQVGVTVNAGHDAINITDNHGTINSDVNIQIIKPGKERGCL